MYNVYILKNDKRGIHMTAKEKIKSMLEEVRSELTDIEKIDKKSYQLGVSEGLEMALQFLRLDEYKNN